MAITQWLPVDFVKNVGDVETDYFFGILPNVYDYVFIVVALRSETSPFSNTTLPIASIGVCGELSVTQTVFAGGYSSSYYLGIYAVPINGQGAYAPQPGDGVYIYWDSSVTSYQITGHMMIFVNNQISNSVPLEATGSNSGTYVGGATPTVQLSTAASVSNDFSIWALQTTSCSAASDTGLNPQPTYSGTNYGTIQDSTTAWSGGTGPLTYTVVTANSNAISPANQSATWGFTIPPTNMNWLATCAAFYLGPAHTLQITSQPVSANIAMFQTATFTATATSDDIPITYQWQISTDGGVTWTNIPGATSSTYTTPIIATVAQATALYQCIITDTG